MLLIVMTSIFFLYWLRRLVAWKAASGSRFPMCRLGIDVYCIVICNWAVYFVLCDMAWYGNVWYKLVLCGMIWYIMIYYIMWPTPTQKILTLKKKLKNQNWSSKNLTNLTLSMVHKSAHLQGGSSARCNSISRDSISFICGDSLIFCTNSPKMMISLQMKIFTPR